MNVGERSTGCVRSARLDRVTHPAMTPPPRGAGLSALPARTYKGGPVTQKLGRIDPTGYSFEKSRHFCASFFLKKTRRNLNRWHQVTPDVLLETWLTHRTTVSPAHQRSGEAWRLSTVRSALERDSRVVQPRGGAGKDGCNSLQQPNWIARR